MARVSSQHRLGLIFCGIVMLVFGAGIIVAGCLTDYLDPYDDYSKVETLYYTHPQYWVGIPLFLLGIHVMFTSCSKVSLWLGLGLFFAILVMALSMFAVILEGPRWRITLQNAIYITENDDICDTVNGRCSCLRPVFPRANFVISPLECDEIRYLAVMDSFIVALSALSILVCVFCSFIYFRILGWMVHISRDNPIDDYYAKAANSHFINGHHGKGVGRANEVAMGTYPN